MLAKLISVICILSLAAGVRDEKTRGRAEGFISAKALVGGCGASNNSACEHVEQKVHPLWGQLDPKIGNVLALYTLMNTLVGITDRIREYGVGVRYGISNDVLKNLDPLMQVHDLLVHKLKLEPAHWWQTCDNNTQDARNKFYKIKQFSRIEEDQCESHLKQVVHEMRGVLVRLNNEANKLIDLLINTKAEPEPFQQLSDRGCFEDLSDRDSVEEHATQCEGMESALSSWGKEVKEWKGNPNKLCRELDKAVVRSEVIKNSMVKCREMPACQGFTLYNGTIQDFSPYSGAEQHDLQVGDQVEVQGEDMQSGVAFRKCRSYPVVVAHVDGDQVKLKCGPEIIPFSWHLKTITILGVPSDAGRTYVNRVCFRTSVQKEYFQEATECFKKPRDKLWGKDSTGVAAWLNNLGLNKAAGLVKTQDLNGMAVMSMGRLKLQEKLDLSSDDAQAVMCHIDAERGGTGDQACTKDVFSIYKKVQAFIDPYVFFGLKIDLKNPLWLARFADKLAAWCKGYIGQYAFLATGTSFLATEYLNVVYSYNSMKTLGDAVHYNEFNWLAITMATATLVNQALNRVWNQCSGVESWLEQTDLGNLRNLQDLSAQVLQGVGQNNTRMNGIG